ncbi:MAG: 16S rRNA (cytosine(967)-C(5))-methyltransferase RsmB [Acidobacteriota bacterium]|nr:16S rRNA (cytosine(967)-C(5))-methyltransferase RsmB [Acidobacteriota bacterium]
MKMLFVCLAYFAVKNNFKMKISPARIAAFEILNKIDKEKAFSSVLLPFYEGNLVVKDRALCHQLTLGVLRKQIYLDKIIDTFTNNRKLDLAVRIALRLGIYQLLFLDKIPDYSAINESVNLVQFAKKTSAKGFVNAVLRRVLREEVALKFTDEIERVSVETSFPRWLIENWIKQFGFEKTEKLAGANNETPPMVFRLTAKSDVQTLEVLNKIGVEIGESEFVQGAFHIEQPNDILFAFAEEGKIYFQEESSQLVGNTVNLKKNEKFLDVCAAPGSKTTQISFRFQVSSSGFFVAGDLHRRRVQILQDNCRKQEIDFVQIVQYDAEKSLPFAECSFDVVLIDAPCSGTGTIRHNPEIRYFLTQKDFAELSAKQLKILRNASKVVKSGGRLIYSTCSLEREENEAVCEKFLCETTSFDKVFPQLPERFLTQNGFARTFPDRDKMGGFFIAAFQKK